MKKFFVTAVLAIAAMLSVSAQDSQRVRYGVEGGFNYSSISTEDTEGMPGFNAGVKLEVGMPNINKGLYMSFGFKITTKHWKISDVFVTDDEDYGDDYFGAIGFEDGSSRYLYTATAKVKPYYLDIPIHVGYKFNLSPRASMFVEAGPYVDLGLFGKCTYSFSSGSESYSITGIDNLFTEEDAMRRLDVGVGLKLGVEFANHYQVSLGYDHGLSNVFKDSEGESCKNRNLTVSVAYVF